MRVLKRVLIFFTVICLLAGASIALNDSSRTRPGKDLSELQGILGKAGEGRHRGRRIETNRGNG